MVAATAMAIGQAGVPAPTSFEKKMMNAGQISGCRR